MIYMEAEHLDHEKAAASSAFVRGWSWFKGLSSKLLARVNEIISLTTKVAKDDPRRVIHSLKFGLALSLVSFLYYFDPLYTNFGASTMWALVTVIVVFEFSVGATIGKGLNRGLASLVGGILGLGAHHLASLAGKSVEPVLMGLFVFIQAAISTFMRFFPRVKARYDYGMLMFILTFCLVCISGFRTHEVVKLARERLATVLMGALTSVIVSVFVYPVWAGDDLHKLVARNIDNLGNVLEGLMDERLSKSEDKTLSLPTFNTLLVDSKSSEDNLANFARWEPGHGGFTYGHPWKQYIKIGNLTRECASRVEALNSYINSIDQAPHEVQGIIYEALSRMSSECGKALKQVAWSCETMTMTSSSSYSSHNKNLKTTSENLKSLLKSSEHKLSDEYRNVLVVMPIAALLIDAVSCVEHIAEAVDELGFLVNIEGKDGINGVDEGDHDQSSTEGKKKSVEVASVSITIDDHDGGADDVIIRVQGQSLV